VNYEPTPATLQLFEQYCGIKEREVLKERATRIQAAAVKVFPYRCIQEYRFMHPRCMGHPSYDYLKQHGDQYTPRRVLDIGCCMGTDVRQMLTDKIVDLSKGDTITGVDIASQYFTLGYDLFGGDKEKVEKHFVTCDILSDEGCKKLVKDHGPFNVVYCGSVYHLLLRDQTERLTAAAFQLTSNNSVYFGRTVGSNKEGGETVSRGVSRGGGDAERPRYLHSQKGFQEMLEAAGFVDVQIIEMEDDQRQMLHFTAYKKIKNT